jgi:hypothetical protein
MGTAKQVDWRWSLVNADLPPGTLIYAEKVRPQVLSLRHRHCAQHAVCGQSLQKPQQKQPPLELVPYERTADSGDLGLETAFFSKA